MPCLIFSGCSGVRQESFFGLSQEAVVPSNPTLGSVAPRSVATLSPVQGTPALRGGGGPAPRRGGVVLAFAASSWTCPGKSSLYCARSHFFFIVPWYTLCWGSASDPIQTFGGLRGLLLEPANQSPDLTRLQSASSLAGQQGSAATAVGAAALCLGASLARRAGTEAGQV